MNFAEMASVPSDRIMPPTDQLRLAVAAYLARFKGSSREHTESGLRCFLSWCAEHGLSPLAARRPHLERYIRWMQEIRRFQAICGVAALLSGSRLLPDLRHRRRPGALTCRARPAPLGPGRITGSWVHAPAILRPCSAPPGSPPIPATSRSWPCWAAGLADLRGHRLRHH
jgi:hypothetical protein